MKRTFFVRSLALAACLAASCAAASAQQPAPRSTRGGLDNLSLPARRAEGTLSNSTAGWQRFAPQGDIFSVEMPGQPTKRAAAGRSNDGGRTYRLESDGILYEVTCTDQIPKEFYALDNFEEGFLNSLSGSLEAQAGDEWPQMNLRTTAARPITLGGYKGRALELTSAQYRSSVRAYVVNRALVVVAMTGLKSAFNEEKLGGFFGSFRLN